MSAGLDAGAGDGIEQAEQLVHAVGLMLDRQLAPGALAAPTLLEILAGRLLVDVIAHRVAEHVGRLVLGGGKEFGLVDGGVLGRLGDDPGVLRCNGAIGQRLGRVGEISQLAGEFDVALGAAAGLPQPVAHRLGRLGLAITARQLGDRLRAHRGETRLAAPHQPQPLLKKLAA